MDVPLAAAVAALDDLVLLGLAEHLSRHSRWPSTWSDDPAPDAAVAADLGTCARHRWVVAHWIGQLREHGVHDRPARSALSAARRRCAEAAATLGYGPALVDLLLDSLRRLPELLADRLDVQTLLYPDGDVVTAEVAYRTNAISRVLNARAAAAAARTARHTGRAVRVLELGAGIGATTADLLPALVAAQQEVAEYRYTDLSPFFLQTGRDRFGAGEPMQFQLLDIDTIGPVPAPGDDDRVDLVVAATMAHNARNVDGWAAGVAARLTPGGALLLIEPVREHAQSLTTMPFALSTRTGAPVRTDLRAGTTRTYLTRTEWTEVLTRAGLRIESVLPAAEDPLTAFSQTLFTATRDERTTS